MNETDSTTSDLAGADAFTEAAQQFSEASAALAELKDEIASLAELKKLQSAGAEALDRSASAAHKIIDGLKPVGEFGADLLMSLKSAVSAAQVVLDRDTAKAIRDDIAKLTETVEAQAAAHATLATERDEALQQLTELQARIYALPEKLRRRHGLE